MTKNVEVTTSVEKNDSMGLLRKFSQAMRSSGVIPRIKSKRYNERQLSTFKNKKEKLRKMDRLEGIERDLKLGKKVNKRR